MLVTAALLTTEVANELLQSSSASLLPATRTGLAGPDLLVTGLAVATALVALGQVPSLREDLARSGSSATPHNVTAATLPLRLKPPACVAAYPSP